MQLNNWYGMADHCRVCGSKWAQVLRNVNGQVTGICGHCKAISTFVFPVGAPYFPETVKAAPRLNTGSITHEALQELSERIAKQGARPDTMMMRDSSVWDGLRSITYGPSAKVTQEKGQILYDNAKNDNDNHFQHIDEQERAFNEEKERVQAKISHILGKTALKGR